ncbi:MAG: GNAT family N-acetyltransferase [Clostridium sp.]|nr:GNAT family N-acetyltransferase [Clostridium sp.]
MEKIVINAENIASVDANILINELSDELKDITGSDGRSNFNTKDVLNERALFVIARDSDNEAVGCGVLRNISNDVAEIKRMYARKKHKGIGSSILCFLEERAKELHYKKIVISTRKVNTNAVNFYKNNGYKVIDNYGVYAKKPESICFEKCI